jgi:nucleoside-diphosphate-sugar epimerase
MTDIVKVCVTGASGKAGRAAVSELASSGFEVLAVDLVPAALSVPFLRADLCDYGQTVEILSRVDAVVHLANIPASDIYTPAVTFMRNTEMNANVFLGAAQVGLQRVVWASSETTLGLPFDTPPSYVPVDEDHFPYPTSTYALSKVVGETLAAHVSAWSGIPFIGLRLSNIHTVDDYERVPGYWADPMSRKWNLWGYIDVRDAAAAFRLALRAPLAGAQNFIIAATDTIMDRPSLELMHSVFPGVRSVREIGEFETLLSNEAARRALGFEPRHSWRDHVGTR